MHITKIRSGPKYELYAIVVEGRCIVQEYLSTLTEIDLKQVISLFEKICIAGPPHNIEKFRNLENDIYELKTRRGIRILCFFAGPQLRNALVLTHGYPKPTSKIVKREVKRAEAWYQEYSGIADITAKIIVMEPH